MSALSVWPFPAVEDAGTALRVLERRQLQHQLVIDDAALVAWERDRPRPSAYQVGTTAGTATLTGAFWGLLFATTLLLPLAGQPGVGLSGLGLTDELLRSVRVRVGPGTSALFLLTDEAEVDRIHLLLGSAPLVGVLDAGAEAGLHRAFSSAAF